MSAQKSSSLAQRLVLLVTLPVLVMMMTLGLLVRDSYEALNNARQTDELMQLSVAAGELIHTLQSERGSTAGYVQSKGQKFHDVLPTLRGKTDDRLKNFEHELSDLKLENAEEIRQQFASTRSQLQQLMTLRAQANQFAISASESTAFYSKTIAMLIQQIGALSEFNTHSMIARQANAYLSLIRGKENAGQERALTTPLYVSGKVELPQYQIILERIYKQDAYFSVFESFARQDEKLAFHSVMEGQAAKEVTQMRQSLGQGIQSGNLSTDPTHWFGQVSAKIDGLRKVEMQIAENIEHSAQDLIVEEQQLFTVYLILGALSMLATVLVALWVGRGVTRPLAQAVEVAEYAVKHNDFTRPVPEAGATEVIRTAQAMNLLVSKFRTILHDTSSSSERLTQASMHLSGSSQEINRSASITADATSSVAATIEQVSVSVSQTSSSAKAISELVEDAGRTTQSAMQVMADAVHNIDEITVLLQQSTSNVAVLEDSSQQIGGIIKVIKEIADQTNLLALNAAIESARAGEQGRGFAVVADEVRKLAERTTTSTIEIATLVETIRTQIAGAVTSMQGANQAASLNKSIVTQSEHALQGIDQGSRTIAEHVRSIAEAIHEQDIAIQQLASNVESIAQMTDESREAAAANRDTADNLDNLAKHLSSSVSQFRV